MSIWRADAAWLPGRAARSDGVGRCRLEKYARTYLRTTVHTTAATLRGSLRGTFSKMRLTSLGGIFGSPTKPDAALAAPNETMEAALHAVHAVGTPIGSKHVEEKLPAASSAIGKVVSYTKVEP